jgi:hypothetical protein
MSFRFCKSVCVLLIGALALAIVGPAQAEGIITMGHIDCGLWAEARTSGRSQILEEHLIGFLNGLTLGTMSHFWIAGDISRQQVHLWMDKYCRDNPLSVAVPAGALLLHRSVWAPLMSTSSTDASLDVGWDRGAFSGN